jgi:hypothetical protein
VQHNGRSLNISLSGNSEDEFSSLDYVAMRMATPCSPIINNCVKKLKKASKFSTSG